jgi:hypothetical protein
MIFVATFFSILSLVYCGSVRFPIQRDFDRGYVPTIDLVVAGLYFGDDFTHPFDLAIESQSRLYQPLSGIEDDAEVIIPFEGVDVEMDRASLTSRLGIGPGSAVLEKFGSAGIFANQLVLNITEFDFSSRCVPGSNITIPVLTLDEEDDEGYSVAASISLGLPQTVPSVVSYANLGGILSVPVEFQTQVINHFTSVGAVHDPDSFFTLNFYNCSSHAIHSLPDFVIDFGSHGRVSVHPSMLINRYPDLNNLCTVEFRVEPSADNTWVFNPLSLPKVAMYITNDGESRFCNEVDL